MRLGGIVLALALLLPACATTMTPEQARVDGIAQECLRPRDRDTLQRAAVDTFGRIVVSGRHTQDWEAELEAFWTCLEAKGVPLRDRPPRP